MVRDPATWPRLEKYIKDIISTFRDDRRVWVWDLYNEPTNGGLGDVSLPLSEKVFVWAREINPTQPLTLGTWSRNTKLNGIIFRHSDIITFHNYSKAEHLRDAIGALKKHGRPIINTEWLNRPTGSLVETCLPVFAAENVGCMQWGLVKGRTRTHLGWGSRPGKPAPEHWQRDLFHGDHTACAPGEITMFKKVISGSKPAN